MKSLQIPFYRFLALAITLALLSVLAPVALAQGGFSDAQVVTSYLNMRAEPNDGAGLVQRLSFGTRLSILGRNENATWLFVSTEAGVTGWIASNWIAIRNDIVLANLPLTNQTGTPASAEAVAAVIQPPAPSGDVAAQASGVAQGGATALVMTRVNFRSGPGTQHPSLGVLNPGTPLLLQGRDFSMLWVYATTNEGLTGWLASRYLSTNLAVVGGLPISDGSAPTGTTSAAPPAITVADAATSTDTATAEVAQPAASAAQPAAPLPSTVSGGFELGGQIRSWGQEGWMQSAGMTWVKQQVVYGVGSNADGLAGMINDAHARGFRILLSVKGHAGELASVPDFIDQFAAFLGGAAALGADGIEVWNEMNIDREWPVGRIDPSWYTQMLAAAYNAIKANNPGTLVISGAPSPTGAEGAFGTDRVWNDDRYIAGMAAAGAAQYMDCVGVHYNEGIVGPSQRSGDPRGNDYYTRFFWGMVDTYSNAFGGQRPLCFTELGYLTPEGYGALPGGFSWASNVTVAQQAQWLAEAVSLSRSSGRVRLLIVWNVDFTGTFGEDPMGGYAIIRPNGDCPACRAIVGQ